MKLEITLTNEQAAPFVAALEKLANPLVAVMPEPTAIPADKEPEPVKPWEQPCPKCGGPHWSTNCPTAEPVKRREWDIRRNSSEGYAMHASGPTLDKGEVATVREVLPGDPTPEQVEELVRASETFLNNWTNSKNSNALKAALQPFTGKDKP